MASRHVGVDRLIRRAGSYLPSSFTRSCSCYPYGLSLPLFPSPSLLPRSLAPPRFLAPCRARALFTTERHSVLRQPQPGKPLVHLPWDQGTFRYSQGPCGAICARLTGAPSIILQHISRTHARYLSLSISLSLSHAHTHTLSLTHIHTRREAQSRRSISRRSCWP